MSFHKWISNIQCRFFILCKMDKLWDYDHNYLCQRLNCHKSNDINIFNFKKHLKKKFEMENLRKLH
jgi:hypothetical protein